MDYLRNTRNIHNMLLVYAPDQPSTSITSPLGYEERWPGDGYVDIAAFDHYDHPPQPHHCAASNFSAEFLQDIHTVVHFAAAHSKVPAIAEFGIKTGCEMTLDADWWTKCFLDPIAEDPVASKVAYAMTWGNRGELNESRIVPDSGFVPMRGDFTFQNFAEEFVTSKHTLLLRGWNAVQAGVKTDDRSAVTVCSSALDCSLNGACSASGVCDCEKPWHGPQCELMMFKPVVFPQGYGMAPNLTTWGGGAIFDAATKKHLLRDILVQMSFKTN